MKIKLIILMALSLQACSNNEKSRQLGELLFHQVHIGKNNVIGCISCHSLKTDIKTVGPSLFGIGLRTNKLVNGMSAQEYLKQSIINPNAHVVSGYSPAIMFAHYQDELNETEINNLVNFLLSLK
ncbi:MAG: c-type cytochrome [Alcanivoracaceae bacterium]|nr:c-type cytochrome [Alcanivoracaceae bacterium]